MFEIWDWLFVSNYWQPVSGIFVGLLPYIWVIKKRGWNTQGVQVWESFLLMLGGLLIILALLFLTS